MAPVDTAAQLAAIDAARGAGDERTAAWLRVSLLVDRHRDRVAAGAAGPLDIRIGDVSLLIQTADDFAKQGEFVPALDLLRAAYFFSEHLGSAVARQRVIVHGVYVRCAMLDLAGAEADLSALYDMDGVSLDDANTLKAARSLLVDSSTHANEVAVLRAESVYALARFRAATGSFTAADDALTELLAMLDTHPVEQISRDDVALLRAELRIDRGDFVGFDALYRTAMTGTPDPAIAVAWQLIEGSSLYLRGRMTEARERLMAVDRLRDNTPRLRRYRRLARWQLVQVLAALNCMDEGEQALVRFAEDGTAEEVDDLRRLFAARRAGGAEAFTARPAPRELEEEPIGRWELPVDDAVGTPLTATTDVAFLDGSWRAYERVHDEWAHAARSVYLDLERGQRAHAEASLRSLAAWILGVDSPLLHARFFRLCALVAYYDDDVVADGTAETLAENARARFERLEALLDEWDASRLRYRALARRTAPRADVDAEAQRASGLLARIEQRLDAVDRTLFRLNKWSSIDDAIAARINTLSGAMSPRSMRRATQRIAHEIGIMKRWQSPSRRTRGVHRANDVPSGSDVFAWAYQQAKVHAARIRRLGESLPIRSAFMPRDVALLAYTILPARVEAFLVHRSGCVRLPIEQRTGRRELFDASSHALRALADSGQWTAVARAGGGLATLSAMLGLPELDQMLPKTIKRIVIELDDAVVHLPFAALVFRGAPLVSSLDVCVTPYARWTERKDPPGRYRRAVGVGVPAPLYSVEGQRGETWNYPPLDDPRQELSALAAVAASGHTVLRDEHATATAVLDALANTELAHFACHGDYFAGADDPCSLMVWDRPLRVADVQGRRMPELRFVALGACWSGNQRILPGREAVGMPAAFLENGAGAVLAALWALPDKAAAEFAREMYARAQSVGIVPAISQVQRDWSASRPTAEWALYQTYLAGIAPVAPVRLLLRAGQWLLAQESLAWLFR